MKKFYYFSKSKLKFVEIRNFYKKFVFLVLFFSVIVSFFVFGTFLVFNEFINPDSEVKSLKKNNTLLKEKFDQLFDKYKRLDDRIASISSQSHDLRLKANLEPLTNEESFGTGGGFFEPIKVSSLDGFDNYIDQLDSYVNGISLKVKLEKNNYDEINKSFADNEKLFDVLPAIRPCEGRIADDFGMRMHPILKFVRMHNGLDIITDTGTKVYAPGAGVVAFAGWRGGYGRTIEIEHGFGYKTIYAHLEDIKVRQGQNLQRGDFIALSGNSGKLSTGPHLHYEVRHNGIALDPRNFIYDDVSIFEVVKK
ncbi:MAG: peptidoglycan DD-metalloendopeptidase family protein [Melioribacteraceae bacterium]